MNYRLVHSIVNEVYTDIPNPQMPPQAHLRDLRRYAGALDVLELGMEESYCYLSLRTPGEIPVAYLGRTGRKHSAVSEGYFIQCAGWQQMGDVLLEHFDEILGTRFFSEAEVDAFAEQGRVPTEEETPVPRAIQPVKADREAIRAVLYGAMLRWQQGTPQVHIAVPKAEMGRYNDYVLGAVKTIWSYFPAHMRAAVGFSSYLNPRRERDFPKFSIVFVPYHMADVNTIRLDGSSPNAYAAMVRSTGMPQLDMVLETLASLDDPEERKSFLRGVYEDMEKDADLLTRNFSPMAYVKWGRGLELLNAKGGVGELLPKWVSFSRNKEAFPPVISRRIDQEIDRRLNPQELGKALEQELRGGRPSVSVLDKAVEKYLPLCAERPACRAALWTFVRDSLEKSGLPAETVYDALSSHEQSWGQLTDPKSYGECRVNCGQRAALARRDRQARLMRESGAMAESRESVNPAALQKQLQEQRGQFRRDAARFVDEVSLREMELELEKLERYYVSSAVNKELQRECAVMPEGHRAIRMEQEKVEKLAQLLPEVRNSQEQELYVRMQNRQAELTALMSDNRTAFADLLEKVRGINGYFEALDVADAQADRLSPEDRTRLQKSLADKRPNSRAGYLDAFRRRYGQSLSIRALADKKSFFRACVEEDLMRLYDDAQRMDLVGGNAASVLRQIQTLKRENELFGGEGTLRLVTGRDSLDADMAERILGMHPDDVRGQDRQRVGETGMKLLRARLFDADQLCSLMTVFSAAECKLDIPVKAVFSGEAGELSQGEYTRFLRQLLAIQQEKKGLERAEALGWISERLEGCAAVPEAEAAFRQLANEGKKGKKGKVVLIVLVAVLSLLVLAAAYWIFLRPIFAFEPEAPAPTETVESPLSLAYRDERSRLDGVFDLANHNLSNESLAELPAYYRLGGAFANGQLPDSLLDDAELLEQLGYLTGLNLSGNPGISDLSSLGQLSGLRRIYLNGDTAVTSLNGLESLMRLELLSLRGASVPAEQVLAFSRSHPDCVILFDAEGRESLMLNGVSCARGDVSLDLSGHGAALLRALDEPDATAALSGLRELHLGGETLDSLDPLACLSGLNYLDLSQAGLRDEQLASLQGLQGLAVLDLRGNSALSDAALENLRLAMPNCGILSAPETEERTVPIVVELAGQSYPIGLESLDLSGIQLTPKDLEKLRLFEDLRELDLSGTGLSDLSALKELKALKRLTIRATEVTDLAPLWELPALESLYAEGTPLETLGLPAGREVPGLRILALSGASAELDLSGLKQLTGLTVLDLGDLRENPEAPLAETLQAVPALRILKVQRPEQLSEVSRAALEGRCVILTAYPAGTAPVLELPADEAGDSLFEDGSDNELPAIEETAPGSEDPGEGQS